MKPCVIFDLDGTLLDTLEDLCDATCAALEAFGLEGRTPDEVRSFVGSGVRNLMQRAIPEGEAHPRFEEILAHFRAHYAAHCRDKTHPYPGILPLLEELRERGAVIGVVSNKFDAATKALSEEYFGPLVDLALGESPSIGKKPAPDSVFAAMKALGADPHRTVMVGDSDVDVLTGKNAGIPTVGVLWGFRDRDCLSRAGASALAATSEELGAALLPLLGYPQEETQ